MGGVAQTLYSDISVFYRDPVPMWRMSLTPELLRAGKDSQNHFGLMVVGDLWRASTCLNSVRMTLPCGLVNVTCR